MFKVLIKNKATNEVRETVFKFNWHDHTEFWLTEGSASCDCNLGKWFADAGNEKDPNCDCCGDQYTPVKAILENGTEVLLCI